MIKINEIETPLGAMVAAATEEGLCMLAFSDQQRVKNFPEHLELFFGMSVCKGENKHLTQLSKQLNEYFSGTRIKFSIPLVTQGSQFQQEVWQGLLKIPFGSTLSYRKQAEALGKPGAARAVANANGRNRISILIPCHRVTGSGGDLTGYSGGLKRKKWLLDHEKKYSGKTVELSLFQKNIF